MPARRTVASPRTLVYVRVSKEREGMISPELQLSACEALERTIAGHRRVQTTDATPGVIQDIDVTGRTFDRPGIRRVMAMAAADEFDVLIVWKWSRVGRNLYQSLRFLQEVEREHGKVVRAATEDIDTSTAVGAFSRDQMLSLAQLQSDQISEQWREAHDRRLSHGRPSTGRPVVGYVYVTDPLPNGRHHNGRYEPDPVMGPLLAEAYDRYLAGEPMRSVAADLGERGLTTAWGNRFEDGRLLRVLDTGFAAGWLRRDVKSDEVKWIRGSHEPLIGEDVWQRFKAKRASVTRGNSRRAAYMCSGLVVCASCEGRCAAAVQTNNTGRGPKNLRAFKCRRGNQRVLSPGDPGYCAKSASIRIELLDEYVRDWLLANAKEEAVAVETIAEGKAKRRRPSPAEKAARELATLRTRLDRARDLYELGDLDRETYLAKRDTLRTAISEAEAVVREPEVTRPEPAVFRGLADLLDSAPAEALRPMLATVIREIRVRPGRMPLDEKITIVPAWAD